MNKQTVVVGGQSYTVEELPSRKNAAWRQQFSSTLDPFWQLIEQAGAGVELRTSEDLLRIVNSVLPSLLNAPELLFGLLKAYSPVFTDDLLDEAYDSEITAAFVAVLGLAFPFGALVKLARSASGSTAKTKAPTSMNSPSPNGANRLPMPLTKPDA